MGAGNPISRSPLKNNRRPDASSRGGHEYVRPPMKRGMVRQAPLRGYAALSCHSEERSDEQSGPAAELRSTPWPDPSSLRSSG
jgi:hypothetical protein